MVGDAKILDIIQLFRQPAKISRAVAVRVEKGAHVHFINNAVLVPERVPVQAFAVVVGSGHAGHDGFWAGTVVVATACSRVTSLNSRNIRRTTVWLLR